MGADPGMQLLEALRRALIGALHDAVREVRGDLTALTPATAFVGTGYDALALQQASTPRPQAGPGPCADGAGHDVSESPAWWPQDVSRNSCPH